jgi:Spy/CpxP family protein refolding chaperone
MKEVLVESNGKRYRTALRAAFAGVLGLALVSILALSTHARGPGKGWREPSPDRAVARLAERLELTAEQQGQVRPILEENFAKRHEIRKEAYRKMQTLREETDGKLSGVLTPEQMTRLRELRTERGKRFKDGGRRHGGPKRGVPGIPSEGGN